MKCLLFLAVLATAPALAANVSVNVGQPGFYGRIDIGNVPQPQVIYREPMVIQRAPVYVERQPIYLHVPPGHAKKWSKHCSKYNACGQPVYFVNDNWYNTVYVPRYREVQRGRHGEAHEHDDDRGRDGDHDRGHGKKHGKKHGKGHKD